MWCMRGIVVLLGHVLLMTPDAWAGSNDCAGDFNDDGTVTINEVITSVNNLLAGCPAPTERFVNNRDGTITDHKTGLIWEQKFSREDPQAWAGTCTNAPKSCQPTVAASALCTAQTGSIACAQCAILMNEGACSEVSTVWSWVDGLNSRNLGGYSDWRLPRIEELTSIVDYSRAAPAIDRAFYGVDCKPTGCSDATDPNCSCVQQTAEYWTATGFAGAPNPVWGVFFNNGALRTPGLQEYVFVRAVRGGP